MFQKIYNLRISKATMKWQELRYR